MNLDIELLEYYKRLNGIDALDCQDDEMLAMLIDTAIMIAKQEACDWGNWDNFNDLPKPIVLGILELVDLLRAKMEFNAKGVKSQSIGGMSQTFFDSFYVNSKDYFKPATDLFKLFCNVQDGDLVFKRAKRGGCCGI